MREVQAFLGLLNYYRRFLYNLSTVLAPLHKLLCKGQKWLRGPPQQRSLQRAKELLLSAEVSARYDPNKPILLQCDASNYDLAQCSRTPWKVVPLDLQQGHPTLQLDKEGAPIMFALKKFHKQIYGRCFVNMTDHKPLVSLFGELKQVPVTVSSRVTVGDRSAWVRVQDPL